ncbi:MAG TPA: desulfoferrodoxin [bacterium]|nr:desulfoferrodoxin [bacterium]HOL47194.1 desulfoferrodoxin [bacterium]HPQ17686.1 desulfoferrodoxin [bacterium]
MAVKTGIYKCFICGNVVEVAVNGKGTLVCCGQDMKLMDEKTKEGAGEKHLPVIEEKDNSILVKVGSVPHPMESEHWIQFIEVFTKDGFIIRKDLTPSDKPEAIFNISKNNVKIVREFCNKHGLWSVSL